MGCLTDRLAANIANDCDNLTVSGIESDALLIPHSAIDKTATTFDAINKMIITDLVLKSGSTGYLIEGVKQTNGYNWEFVKGDSQTRDMYKHLFNGMVLTPSAVNRESANKLGKGESYLVVVNKKYKGASNEDAFLVLGWSSGLYLNSMTENSREQNAAIVFELASDDEMLENNSPNILLDTDYATTLTAFSNKFVQI